MHCVRQKEPVRVVADHLVLATGSTPMELKNLPFGGPVISSRRRSRSIACPTALRLSAPAISGVELGVEFAKLGLAVTIVESADRILPAWDAELTKPVATRLERLGVKVLTGGVVSGLSKDGDLLIKSGVPRNVVALACNRILVAVGRNPRTSGFGLDRLDLNKEGSFIRIDTQCATSMRNVWAIGDVTGPPMLAHRAMAQGKMVARTHRRSARDV